jgi:restriction system protein
MNDVFHYPPDLFELVIQTIPLLNRSKKSVLLFFNGAGVDETIFTDITNIVRTNKESINHIYNYIFEKISEIKNNKYITKILILCMVNHNISIDTIFEHCHEQATA